MLQGFLYELGAKRGEDVEVTHSRWLQFATDPGQWDLGVMLLAQHHGVPTHGIDITHDLDVALWFATNRYDPQKDGTAIYRQLSHAEWGDDTEKWPIINVIIPVTHSLKGAIRDVDLLVPLGIEAPRPRRQSAAFFMGAHGLHRNRLAEALACVLRLAPGSWSTQCDYASLFPLEDEDPIFDGWLKLKHRFTEGDAGKFLQVVPRYVRRA